MYTFFNEYDEIVAGMSTKIDGNMKVRGEDSDPDAIINRKQFCNKNNIDYNKVVSACIAHGKNVAVINSLDNNYIDDVDALVTNEKNIFLSITSADCFPIIMYDDKNDVIGIAHAGWKGVVKNLIEKTIEEMQNQGADTKNIKLTVGPGISQKHFDFSFQDLINEFGFYNQDKYIIEGSTLGKVRVDLHHIIIDQLIQFGIEEKNINDCNECTFENEDKYFSARRDGEVSDISTMLSIVGMSQ